MGAPGRRHSVDAVHPGYGLPAVMVARMSTQYTLDTAELKRLAMAATSGPWKREPDNTVPVLINGCVFGGGQDRRPQERIDADFIAAANPAAILALIAERDYLKSKYDELLDEVKNALSHIDAPGIAATILRKSIAKARG